MQQPPSSSSPSDLFACISSEALLQLFDERGTVRAYSTGECMLGPGVNGEEVRLILSGSAALFVGDEEVEKQLITKLLPGDIFGGIEFFFGVPWNSKREIRAAEDCTVIEVPPYEFEKTLIERPDFSITLIKQLVRSTVMLEGQVYEGKLSGQNLRRLISRGEHVFPDYIMGDYLRSRVGPRIEELAQSDRSVLFFGESGVGKEGLAHYLFSRSAHFRGVFLALDLLSIRGDDYDRPSGGAHQGPEKILAEEQQHLLFGRNERHPDGKMIRKSGYWELANGGALLIRGVDKLTTASQVQLLDAIRTGLFTRRDGEVVSCQARLIATTRLLPSEVSPDRHPLLWALLESSVHVPPLRMRRKEIPNLVQRYVRKYNQELKLNVEKVPEEAIKLLVNYTWPGNDLELSNTLRQGLLASKDGVLNPEEIKFNPRRLRKPVGYDLLKWNVFRKVMTHPAFPAVLQSLAVPPFIFLILLLCIGPDDPTQNAGAIFSWTVAWPALLISIPVVGRFWCTICPVSLMMNPVSKVRRTRIPWPREFKKFNDFFIAAAILFIIWLETAAGIRESAHLLGLLLLAMLVSGLAVALFFDPNVWCLSLCGLGGMVGVFARTSIVELRANSNVCISQCTNNVCHSGTETFPGCPFGQTGPKLDSNRACKMCGLCIKNCPYSAFSIRLRPPGREIWASSGNQTGSAFLVVSMLGAIIAETALKIDAVKELNQFLNLSSTWFFTLVLFSGVLAVNGIALATAGISSAWFTSPLAENYSRFCQAFLPLVLMAFLAFHLDHSLNHGGKLLFDWIGMPQVYDTLAFPDTLSSTYLWCHVVIWLGYFWTIAIMLRIRKYVEVSNTRRIAGVLPHVIAATVAAVVLSISYGALGA